MRVCEERGDEEPTTVSPAPIYSPVLLAAILLLNLLSNLVRSVTRGEKTPASDRATAEEGGREVVAVAVCVGVLAALCLLTSCRSLFSVSSDVSLLL